LIRFGRALGPCEESLAIRRRLSAAEPAVTGFVVDVSVSLQRVGNLRMAQSDVEGALKAPVPLPREGIAPTRPGYLNGRQAGQLHG